MGLPATEWMLEIGAFLLRTETELILKSRRVVPGLLAKRGFTFAVRVVTLRSRAYPREDAAHARYAFMINGRFLGLGRSELRAHPPRR